MSEFMENKISEEALSEVTGGVGQAEVKVKPITPIWVRVTASSLNCRYTPNGEIAKIYERGHKLKVDGITADGEWPRRSVRHDIHMQIGDYPEFYMHDALLPCFLRAPGPVFYCSIRAIRSYLSVPQKNSASIPGPTWAPENGSC